MMSVAVHVFLALCLFKNIAAAPQQGGKPSSGPTPRECGSYEAVSPVSDGVPPFDSSKLIQLGGMASVYNSKTFFKASTHICGASILSDRYLLTAAHCVAGRDRSFGITVGREDINKEERNVDHEYAIENTFIHPNYNPALHEYNDIALLKTARPITFTNKIWPFCLPDGNEVYDDYRIMQISGWGEVSKDNRADVLQSAHVNLISNSRCDSLWRRHTKLYNEFGQSSYPQGMTNQIICAGRDGVDACKGDSGGPLTDTDRKGRKTVVGIITKRTGCPELPEPPGFYTNTTTYVDWIYETSGIPRGQIQTSTPTATVGIPTKEECGISISDNIVGGELAKEGAWPWLAAIGRMNGTRFEPFCGGTLITRQHVISAAHCFYTYDPRTIVRLGEHNTDVNGDGALDFSIVKRQKASHNKYTKENDIILLKLNSPIDTFTDRIRAACLPIDLADDYLEGKSLTVVGWGVFDNKRKNKASPVPLQVNVPVVPVQECQQKYRRRVNNVLIINENQICAGKGRADSCNGDSGGPLNYLDLNSGKGYLVGVVSFGPSSCGSEHLPGVYARVDQYLDWIQHTIKKME